MNDPIPFERTIERNNRNIAPSPKTIRASTVIKQKQLTKTATLLSTRKLSSMYTFFFHFFLTEIRNHGVGYYQFSTSEKQRQEQMKTLDKLREQVLTGKQKLNKCYEHHQIFLGLCKTRTGRMGNGGWRMTKCAWQNADGKMRMTNCGWQNADRKTRIAKCGW